MLETGLALGMTATHVGVPLADLMAWTIVVALLVAPVQLDERRRQRLIEAAARNAAALGETKTHPAAEAASSQHAKSVVVVPAATRLSAAEQWQTVSRLVSADTERAIAVAREQQAIRRELDSLDFTLENLRRELASVMTLPVAHGAELVPARVSACPRALAA